MDATYLASYAQMDVLFINNEYNECEKKLNELILQNPGVSETEKIYLICTLKKRIMIYYKGNKHDLVLQDIGTLKKMNVVISSNDDIFYIEQESTLALALNTVINNLKNNAIKENASSVALTIEILEQFDPEQIFKRLIVGMLTPSGKRRRNCSY